MMIKHFSVIISILLAGGLYSGTAFAQDTPQNALDDGNFEKALAMLESQTSSSDAETAVEGLCGQAQIAIAQGNLTKASEILASLDTRKDDIKKKNGWNVVILWLKAELAHQQNDVAGYKSYLKAIINAIDAGAKVEESWNGIIYYQLAMAESDNSDARENAEIAIDYLHSSRMNFEEGLAYLRLGDLEWERNKQRRAFRAYDNALRAFRSADGDRAQLKVAELHLIIASKNIEAQELKAAKSRLEFAQKDIELAGNPADLTRRLEELRKQIEE